MNIHQVIQRVFAISTIFCSAVTVANEVYVCKHDNSVRTIRVVYETSAAKVPCEVTYEKSSGVQTLWHAVAEADYCETKASEFVAKQEAWGWECNNDSAETAEADTVDTSADTVVAEGSAAEAIASEPPAAGASELEEDSAVEEASETEQSTTDENTTGE